MNKTKKFILIILIIILIIFYFPMKFSNYLKFKGYSTSFDDIESLEITKKEYNTKDQFTLKSIIITDKNEITQIMNIVSSFTVNRSIINLICNLLGSGGIGSSPLPTYNISYNIGDDRELTIHPSKHTFISIEELTTNPSSLHIILGKKNYKKMCDSIDELIKKYPARILK